MSAPTRGEAMAPDSVSPPRVDNPPISPKSLSMTVCVRADDLHWAVGTIIARSSDQAIHQAAAAHSREVGSTTQAPTALGVGLQMQRGRVGRQTAASGGERREAGETAGHDAGGGGGGRGGSDGRVDGGGSVSKPVQITIRWLPMAPYSVRLELRNNHKDLWGY